MSAATMTTGTTARQPRSRILGVVRLHLVDGWGYLYVPWMVTGAALVISILISIIIRHASGGEAVRGDGFVDGVQFSGAGQAVFWYLLVVSIQTVSLTLPYALGLSITRREFLLGTGALYLGISVVNSALYALLSLVDDATAGWWVGTRMFTSLALFDTSAGGRFVFFACFHLFVLTFGAVMASIHFRWHAKGTTIAIVAMAFLVVGLAALITFADSWPSVGEWFLTSGPVGVALWTLPATVLSGLAAWALLSRATPKG